ncbi:hypothetical protein [Acaryochloris sp. IP29b_bin.137]|uniref:hypothetical protein n=1 Tax=Acaryochloris sp. IP29b_bin.137 TaxID=2969217 RepID=UPI00262A8F0E|nr:hypothetical protein [Acaryochloris sp. IP29b_bin.137]
MMDTITLDLAPFIQMTDDQFFELCQHHRDYRFERNATGALIIPLLVVRRVVETCLFPDHFIIRGIAEVYQ